MIKTRITQMLGIEYPIVQAPMGWIARSQLASAVSNAGGLGIIETSSGELDAVREEVRKMRGLTDKPFGVNIAQAFVRDPDIVSFVVDQGVKFVTTSAGDPNKYCSALKEAGLTVFHVVPSLGAALKAIEAGVDGVDTAISSMSATYGHPATEALVATLAGTQYDTGLDIHKLESIAAYFREVRKKYHAFEGQLKGTDSRILVAQVPGGMLTNLESQLKQQSAAQRLDEVLAEIPRVREDLGFIPLVTPTSQIVGTQAVLNVLTGERYKTIAKETAGILKGEYGRTPAPVNAALQARVLDGADPVTCRPADLLKPELAQLEADVRRQAQEKGITLAENAIDDVLTVALFPQPGLKFLENRHNPAAFEPVPQAEAAQPVAKAEKPAASGVYTVEVEGKAFVVKVSDGGDVSQLTAAAPAPAPASAPAAAAPAGAGIPVTAPLAGTIWKVLASEGQTVAEGEVLLILEAMKMETEIRAAQAGTVRGIAVKAGDAVAVGDTLMTLA